MIISVPHNGTRSLKAHLSAENPHWHWGTDDNDINAWTGHVDIPLRDPFDVLISWLARYPTEENKGPERLFELTDLMIAYARDREDTTIHVVENLPINVGAGPEHWAKLRENRQKARTFEPVIKLVEWIRADHERFLFYHEHYEDFWWLIP